MNANLPNTLTVPVRKVESDFTLDLSKLSPEMVERVFQYGVTQITNDCHSQIKADGLSPAELREQVMGTIAKRWDAIYAGDWRVRGTSESADPVEREALSMAREAYRLAYAAQRRANAKLPKWGDIDESRRDTAVKGHLDRNRDSFMEKARKAIAARKADASAVDLADLGL